MKISKWWRKSENKKRLYMEVGCNTLCSWLNLMQSQEEVENYNELVKN